MTASHVRHYSSGNRSPGGDEKNATQEDDADKSATPAGLTSMFGFQSLSGLFRQPARKKYSAPRSPEQTSNAPDSSSDIRPEGNAAYPPEPTFVPRPAASQSIDSITTGYPSDKPYSPKTEGDSSFAPAKSDGGARQTLARNSSAHDEKPGRARVRFHIHKAEYFRSFRQRRDASRRKENPFTRLPYADKGDQGTQFRGITPPNTLRSGGKQAAHVGNDSMESVDSMLEPGMTNAAFQAQARKETASSTPSSSYTSVQRATSPRKAPESAKVATSPRSSDPVNDTKLTHVTSSGEAHMVDVGAKESTRRVAIAQSTITFSNENPFRLIHENTNKKGDVLGVARIAGIMASKRTADLIPLCHPISISKVEVDVRLDAPGSRLASTKQRKTLHGAVTIHAIVECVGPTGVEMEALTAVSGAVLTVYDMCKAVDRYMLISGTTVVYKSGGRSGDHVLRRWHENGGAEFLEERGIDVGGRGESDTAPRRDKSNKKIKSHKM